MNIVNMIKFQLKLMCKTPIMFMMFFVYPVLLTAIIGYLTQSSFGGGVSSYEYYSIGMMIFIGVSNMPTLSRMIEYFGILEVIIIPNLIYKISEKNKLYKIVFTIFAILVSSTIFIKDLNSFLVEGRYYQKDIFKYPYVTIFNKDEIYLYRESSRVQIID